MADYRIELGVKLKDNAIQNEINEAQRALKPIEIKVDAETKELTNTIKEALSSLSKGTKNALTIDTSGLESSIGEIRNAVVDLRKTFCSIDDSANFKSLLVSVNQIADALGKVTDESETLVKSLSVLSKKDFGFNFNLKTGNANPLKAATDYGKEARRNAIPALQEQASALQNLLGGYLQADKALERYLTKIHKASGISIKNNLIDDMSNTSSIAKQMEAIEKYIGYLKKIAVEKNIDLSGFDAQFSKAAENIVDDTVKIQTGAKQTEEAIEAVGKEMKQIFGGGVSAEGLSASLEPIITNLNEIKIAIKDLSKGAYLDGLTQNFEKLLSSIELLIKNCGTMKTAINNSIDGADASVGKSVNGIKNVDGELKQVTITSKSTADAISLMQDKLQSMEFGSQSIDVVTKELQNMGIEIKEATAQLNGSNLDVTVKGIDSLGEIVTVVRRLNTETGEITQVGAKIKQSFSTSDEIVAELNKEMANFIKLQQQIGNQKIEIQTVKSQGGDIEYIATLERQLESLENTYAELMQTFMRKLSINADKVSMDEIERFDDKIVAINQRADHKIGQIVDSSNAKFLRELNSEMNVFVGLQSQIGKIKLKIGNLEAAGGNTNQVAELNRQLEELEGTYARLMQTFMKKLTANADIISMDDIAKLDAATNAVEDDLRELEAKIADTKAKLAEGIIGNFGKYDLNIDKLESSFGKLSNKSNDLRLGIDEVKQALADMKNASSVDDLIAANDRYETALKDVEIQLERNKIAERDANSSEKLEQSKQQLSLQMSNWLKDNSAAAKEFGGKIRELQAQINSCDATQLDGLKREFDILKQKAKEAGKTGKTFVDGIKSQFAKYSQYFSVASLFMYAEQGLRSMFEQVKLIDSAMTELKKVTNETDESYNRFLRNAADRAKEIGTTIDGLVSSTADFARLGYGFEDAQGLAEVANIYAVVGDEIEGVEGATESLISTMAAFKDSMNGMSNTDFAMSIIDKFNEIGNNFAISSGGIGEALERSASSLMAANNTIDESIALITAAM